MDGAQSGACTQPPPCPFWTLPINRLWQVSSYDASKHLHGLILSYPLGEVTLFGSGLIAFSARFRPVLPTHTPRADVLSLSTKRMGVHPP